MRADVRKAVKQSPATAGPLRALDRNLRYAAIAHGHHSHHHDRQTNHHDPPPRIFSAFAHHCMLVQHPAQKDATPSSHPSGQSAQRFHAPVASCRQSLATWFSVGLLQLQPIHWESSSAALLEKVMAHEAVHPIQGWQDLKQRLGPMRRCPALLWPQRANKGPFLFAQFKGNLVQNCITICLLCSQLKCRSHTCTPAGPPHLRVDLSAQQQFVDALLHST